MTSIFAIAAPHGPLYRNNKLLSDVCLAQKRLLFGGDVAMVAVSFTYVNQPASMSLNFIFRGLQCYSNCDGNRVIVTRTGKARRDNTFMSIIGFAQSTPA